MFELQVSRPRRAAPLLLSVAFHVGAGAFLVVEPLLALPREPAPPEEPVVYRLPVELSGREKPPRPRTTTPPPAIRAAQERSSAPRPAAVSSSRTVAPASIPESLPVPPAAPPADGPAPGPDIEPGVGTGTGADGPGDGGGGGGDGALDEILPIGPRVSPPVLLDGPAPAYPPAALRAGLRGTVVLEAVIGTDGGVRDARVVRGVNPLLDRAAAQAVLSWRYTPARVGSRAVAVYLAVEVRFDIQR